MNAMKSINKTARWAGLLYLLMAPLGVFGILYVPSVLIAADDALKTAANITSNESLFRLSIVSALLVQVTQIFVVLLLYRLLRAVNKNIAALMLVFMLVAIPIAMLNEANNCAVLLLASGGGREVNLLSLFLDLHEYGVKIAGIFWGLWLLPMGFLVFRSRFLPRVLGVFLMIGGLGYVSDSFMFFLFPGFGVTLSSFTFLGEIAFPLWLLIRGVNTEAWEKQEALND